MIRILAWLAVAGQILLGAMVPAAAAPSSGSAASSWPICVAHAPAPAGGSRHPASVECALCPACLLALHAMALPAPPALAASRVIRSIRIVAPAEFVAVRRPCLCGASSRGPPGIA